MHLSCKGSVLSEEGGLSEGPFGDSAQGIRSSGVDGKRPVDANFSGRVHRARRVGARASTTLCSRTSRSKARALAARQGDRRGRRHRRHQSPALDALDDGASSPDESYVHYDIKEGAKPAWGTPPTSPRLAAHAGGSRLARRRGVRAVSEPMVKHIRAAHARPEASPRGPTPRRTCGWRRRRARAASTRGAPPSLSSRRKRCWEQRVLSKEGQMRAPRVRRNVLRHATLLREICFTIPERDLRLQDQPGGPRSLADQADADRACGRGEPASSAREGARAVAGGVPAGAACRRPPGY